MTEKSPTRGVLILLMLFMLWVAVSKPPASSDVQGQGQEPAAQATPEPARDAQAENAAPAGLLPAIARQGTVSSFALCGAQGQVALDDGAFEHTSYPELSGQFQIQPLWAWIFRRITGSTEPWLPYGPDPGPAQVIGGDARAFYAGAGAWPAAPTPAEAIEAPDSSVLAFRRVSGSQVEITQTLRVEPGNPCRVMLDVSWHNASSTQPVADGVWLGLDMPYLAHPGAYVRASRLVAGVAGSLEEWDSASSLKDAATPEGQVQYFGLGDPAFVAIAIPKQTTGTVLAKRLSPEGQTPDQVGLGWLDARPLAPQETRTASFELFMGPRVESVLKAIDPSLTTLIPLGFFSAVAWPLKEALRLLHGLIGNWGWAVIALTFLVKALLFPLTQKSFVSMQKMAAMQPQLQEIQKKYKNDPQELQRRIMAMYAEHGVNPASGCLPMLIQMPIWFGLFRALSSSSELYHSAFWYIEDLSAADPYLLLPTIVLVLMVGQTWLSPTSPSMDKGQQNMIRAMPVVFGLLGYSFPAGLQLYMTVNVSLSLLQQWYIRKAYPTTPQAAPTGGA